MGLRVRGPGELAAAGLGCKRKALPRLLSGKAGISPTMGIAWSNAT